jgi:thymidylate synthase (FAD)
MTDNYISGKRVEVLDHGFLTLRDYMGNDLTVVNAARVSYGVQSKLMSEKDLNLIKYLAKNKHMSPFRHVQFHFHLRAPEFVMRQWYKHTIGMRYTENNNFENDHAWNEISLRYLDASNFDYYVPDLYRVPAESSKQSSKLTEEGLKLNHSAVDQIYRGASERCFKMYQELIDAGVSKEIARGILPLNIYTEVIWTTSLQAAVNFIQLRDHPHAQWEIREYALALKELVSTVAPVSVRALLGEYDEV